MGQGALVVCGDSQHLTPLPAAGRLGSSCTHACCQYLRVAPGRPHPLLCCLRRPYTPVTDDDTPGRVEFVIKVYPSGKMTQVMDKMKVGDSMLMKGPRGRFQYTRNMKRAIGECEHGGS